MTDADDPRIDGYNARTIREMDAERARHEVRGGYTLDGYYGDPELRAKHAAMQTPDDTRPLSAAERAFLTETWMNEWMIRPAEACERRLREFVDAILDAERARPPHDCAASIQINNDLAERLDYWQMGYIGLEARHAALVAAARAMCAEFAHYSDCYPVGPCTCGLDALRAALDGEPR